MKLVDIYKNAYKMLDYVTPLKADCGRACGKACCDGEEDTGMYLFPHEECMFKSSSDSFRIEETDFEYQKGKNASILFCTPPCNRLTRPLACRIFPLFPYIDIYGEMKIIMDPRGRSICPLVRQLKPEDLDDRFCKRVERIFKVLVKNEEIEAFLFSLSRQIDEVFGEM